MSRRDGVAVVDHGDRAEITEGVQAQNVIDSTPSISSTSPSPNQQRQIDFAANTLSSVASQTGPHRAKGNRTLRTNEDRGDAITPSVITLGDASRQRPSNFLPRSQLDRYPVAEL